MSDGDAFIRVFCNSHQSVFDTPRKAALICDITDHPVAMNFPEGENFEFCCDCETFFPSTLQLGEKARKACLLCERKTARRFICPSCKVVSFDSKEETRGALFVLRGASPVLPRCPGCDYTDIRAMVAHQCVTAGATFLTSVENCPFCLNPTSKNEESDIDEAFDAPVVELERVEPPPVTVLRKISPTLNEVLKTPIGPIKCETCSHRNPSDSLFCVMCGVFLNVPIAKSTLSPFKRGNEASRATSGAQMGVESFGATKNSENAHANANVSSSDSFLALKVVLWILAVVFVITLCSRC